MPDSLCWRCAKASTYECSKPVPGWDAVYAPLKGVKRVRDGREICEEIPSWFVCTCPKYEPDERANEFKYHNTGRPRKKQKSTIKCIQHIYTGEVRRFQFWTQAADYMGIHPGRLKRARTEGKASIDQYRFWEEDMKP